MMKRYKKYAALLCLLLCLPLALTACGSGQRDTAAETARGRYIEKALALPENLGYIVTMDQLEDGSLWLLGMELLDTVEGGYHFDYRIWSSADGGESWRAEDTAWLDELGDGVNEITALSFASSGELYFQADDELMQSRENETEEEAPEADVDVEDGEDDAEDEDPYASFSQVHEYYLYRVEGGSLTKYDYSLWSVYGNGETRTVPDELTAAGDKVLLSYYDHIKLVEPATGEEIRRFEVDNGNAVWGAVAVSGDTVAVVQTAAIELFDVNTGALTAEIPYTSAVPAAETGWSSEPGYLTAVAPHFGDDALYYANATGIYRALRDGSLTEKIMDGDLASIGMPTSYVQRLFRIRDGSFLVQCAEEGMGSKLFRYEFDPDAPSVPGSEIKVYSLEDNQTIRQAVGAMQLGDPNVKVNYEVGMEAGSGETAADALRTLSTELLAGSGPDVIVLDGIPIDAYIAQGVLLDLSGQLEERVSSGELQENVAGTYRRDGALYAVPARFSVPLLHGTDIGAIRDLTSLADWVQRRDKGGVKAVAETVMERFYEACAGGWFQADGSLDEAAFRQALTDLMRLTEEPAEEMYYDAVRTMRGGAVELKAGDVAVSFGRLDSLADIAGPHSLMEESGEGEIALFPDGGVYLPRTILGVNAASDEKELAQSFVGLVLSAEILENDFEDGLPANTAALELQIAARDPYFSTYGYGTVNSETGEDELVLLTMSKPDETYLRGIVDMLGGIAAASPTNLVVKQMIVDETLAYFRGDATLDDTVAALRGKLDLYLAE